MNELPPWVQQAILKWMKDKTPGSLTLNTDGKTIRQIERKDVYRNTELTT